jgi:hypothetical protein
MNLVRNNRLLWTIQALLALLFLFTGGLKVVTAAESLAAMSPPGVPQLPIGFLRLVGVLECLGAIGLILPGLLHIREGLTPLAAAGLVGIMIGATIVTAIGMGALQALFPLCVGLLAAFVAYARNRPAAREVMTTA